MDTVAVDAHRLVGLLIRSEVLEEDDGGAVEVGHIGLEDLGGQPVSTHQLLVGVAFSADLGGEQMEPGIGGPLNVVHSVTTGAGGHISISPKQRRPVNTLLVEVVDLRVTIAAGERHVCAVRYRAGGAVGAVAVGAHRGRGVACLE